MIVTDFFRSNKKRKGLILSAIIIVSGLIPLIILTYFADPAHPYTITETILTTEDYVKIQAHIYTPHNMTGNHPGIVIGHGFTGNSRHMQLLAIELVKREFVVVNINFRGHGSSGGYLPSFVSPDLTTILEKDLLAGIQYLNALGNIDRIGIVGHSMGSMTAMRTADDYTNVVNATVLLGMVVGFEAGFRNFLEQAISGVPEVNLSRIQNLLIANGRLEQMFTPALTLEFLELYTNRTDVVLEHQYGSFSNGTAAKAVIGETEHLFEPHDAHIIYETAAWFELAFYGSLRWPITLTSTYNDLSFAITLIGVIAFCFVLVLYVHNYLWKDQPINLRKDQLQNTSIIKMGLGYVGAGIIGLLFLIPGLFLFSEVLPVSMGELLYGLAMGTSIGILVMYYFITRKSESLRLRALPSRIRAMCSGNYWRAILYGIVVSVIFAVCITAIANWSAVITLPTARELGAIFSMAFLFFPWLLLKEFYFRTIQGQLNFSNRFKEYFSMVGIGTGLDSILIVPLMLLIWGKGSIFGFLALALTVVFLFNVIQQTLVTWVYMYSGRNLLGSSIFLSIFYAWMMVNFYPFGLALF
ncbi:MAG: alpha/beta fold hydrolase [Promethearchaeota archaeon]|nr:MAG: alpha/beta fold hydrolase [Candidatus Lokiarchaeota archaeon]